MAGTSPCWQCRARPARVRPGRTVLLCALLMAHAALGDYYADLGVLKTATQEEIKVAYRQRAKELHPDKSTDPDAQSKFTQMRDAYETLSNPEKRRLYDAYGSNYAPRQRSPGFNDPFEDLYRRGFGTSRPGGRAGRTGSRPDPTVSFSRTLELDTDSWEYFVGEREGGEHRLWLILFYSDYDAASARFAPHWEDLAERLHPMIRLGRVNTESVRALLLRCAATLAAARRAEQRPPHKEGPLGRIPQPPFPLGRLHVQRAAWQIVRRYRSVLHRLPTIVMVGDDGGSSERVSAYFGSQLNVDSIGDWCRRFFSPSRIVRVGSARHLDDFVRKHTKLPASAHPAREDGRVPAVIFSPHPSQDSVLFRYLSHKFMSGSEDGGLSGGNGGARVALAHVHVSGGVQGRSGGADAARTLGVQELPALAVWRDGAGSPPEIHSLSGAGASGPGAADADAAAAGMSADMAQRVRLVRLLETRATPRVRKLRASNVHDVCVRVDVEARSQGRGPVCGLLLCGPGPAQCKAALALVQAAEALARADAGGGEARVRWGLVDGVRQGAFARALLHAGKQGRERPGKAAPLPPNALPAIALLMPVGSGGGLGQVRWAVYAGALTQSVRGRAPIVSEGEARALLTWVDAVLAGKERTAKATDLPPLVADAKPGLLAQAYSLVFGEGLPFRAKVGMAVSVALAVGGAGAVWILLGLGQPQGDARRQRRSGASGSGGQRPQNQSGTQEHSARESAREPAHDPAGTTSDERREHSHSSGTSAHHAGGTNGARSAPRDEASSSPRASHSGRGAGSEEDYHASGVPWLRPDGVASVLAAAPFCVLLPHGSERYSTSGCAETARTLRGRYAAERSFHFALVNVVQDDCGNPVFAHLQRVLRRNGCIALRRTSDVERTRAAVYSGSMSPEALSSWLDRLIGGEVGFSYLFGGGTGSGS